MTWCDCDDGPPAGIKGIRGGGFEVGLRRAGADRFARRSCALVVVGMVLVDLFVAEAPVS